MKNKELRGILALIVVTALSFGVIAGARVLSQDMAGGSAQSGETAAAEEFDVSGAEGIEEAVRLEDGGYMVTVRQAGYAGDIVLRVTFEDDAQTLRQVEVLEQNETETLGSRITEPEFLDQFAGAKAPVYLPGMTVEAEGSTSGAADTSDESAEAGTTDMAETLAALEGAALNDGTYEAVNMGAEAKKYCSNCHAELDPGAVFCAECGYQVAPEPGPNPNPTPGPNPVPNPEHQPSGEPRLIGEAAGPFLYSNTKSSQYTGAYNRYLLIYEDRLELRDCRKKQKLEPVILYMRDIGLVQAEASGLIRYGCITLVMKNGERRFLFIAYRSKKGNQHIQEEQVKELFMQTVWNLEKHPEQIRKITVYGSKRNIRLQAAEHEIELLKNDSDHNIDELLKLIYKKASLQYEDADDGRAAYYTQKIEDLIQQHKEQPEEKTFDKDLFDAIIEAITIYKDGRVVFTLKNGATKTEVL